MVKIIVLVVLGLVAYILIKRNISSGKKERAEKRTQSAAYNQRATIPTGPAGGEGQGTVVEEEPREQD